MTKTRTGVPVMTGVLLMLSLMSAPAGAQERPARSRVDGVVFDSVAMRPLGNALVQLFRADDPSSARTANADSLGRFRFDSVSSGAWVIGALHARLDSLGVRQFAREVAVKDNGRTRVTLAVPAFRTLVTRVCGATTAKDSLGYLIGSVRLADAARTPIRATLRVQWIELEISGAGVTRSIAGFEQQTDERGEFIACGIPPDAHIQMQAGAGGDSTGVLDVSTGRQGIGRLDLLLGPATRRQVSQIVSGVDSSGPVSDTLTMSYLTGTGRLQGRVLRETKPLANAQVSVWGTGQEVRSDSGGQFVANGLPLGTHIIETRAIGYEPIRQLVDLVAGETAAPRVSLAPIALLDTVRVRASALAFTRRFDAQGFAERRRSRPGSFLGPEELARMNPMTLSALFTRAPNVQVSWAQGAGEQVTMGLGIRRCTPAFFLDGREVDPEQFQFFTRAMEVVALEVYPRLTGTPPQFVSPRSMQGWGCGSIVVWTGRRERGEP